MSELRLSVKLCYGLPALAISAMTIPIGIHMPRFYSDEVLAPLGYVAIAIAAARALDAITDPLMGWISDHTRSRWGRRLPWIAVGTPLAALCFWALFNPPEASGRIAASVWFAASFGLFYLFNTVASVPRAALGAELSLDYHERSSLFGIETFFVMLGVVLGSVLPGILQQGFGLSLRAAYGSMGLCYGLLLVVLYVPFLWRVRERVEFARRESNPLVPGLRRAVRNRPFRVLLVSYIVVAIPGVLPAIMAPYYVYYVLAPANPEGWLTAYVLGYFATGFLFLPVWVRASRRFGKLWAFVVSNAIGAIGTGACFWTGPGDEWIALLCFVFAGIAGATSYFLVPSMLADVIDYDELRTGKRREGQFIAFQGLVQKAVAIPSASVPLAILARLGYVPNEIQTPEVTFAIRFLLTLFPAIFYALATLAVLFYPLSQSVHEAIRRGIDAHARGASALDPLTGRRLAPHRDRGGDETGWRLDYFSRGELRRLLRHGPGRLRRDVSVALGAAAAVAAGALALAIRGTPGLEAEPGVGVVSAVVAAGAGLTAAAFHALRLAAARGMATAPVDAESIRRHLEALDGAALASAADRERLGRLTQPGDTGYHE